MESMNIAITPGLKEFVQRRVDEGGYSSVSEYVRELIRGDQRQSAQSILEAELMRGLASGPAEEMTKANWARIRAEVRRITASRKKR